MRVHSTAIEEDLLNRLERAEVELESLQAEVEHQQRLSLVGTLAAGVAHEINNLLTPVLAYAQLAEARPGDDELSRKTIEQCLTAVRAATQISSLLLDFASPRDGVSSNANVTAAIQSAIACLGRDLAKDNVHCVIRSDSAVVAAIAPLALQQVLLNLVINARNALQGKRGSELRIEARAAGGDVLIQVIDNGPGIPSSARERLFEPFVVSRETNGHGLGLWICKRLVDAAGGSIDFDSDETGTRFTLRLPAA